jgi:hypothetical protein
MKQLFCVVVTDPSEVIGLVSPIVFHVECEDKTEAENVAIDDLSSEDYGYSIEAIEALDIFSFPVEDIIKI